MPSLSELAREAIEKQRKRDQGSFKDSEDIRKSRKEEKKVKDGTHRVKSDHFRTAYNLVFNKPSRGTLEQIFIEFRDFLNNHILEKKGRFFYFIKKSP